MKTFLLGVGAQKSATTWLHDYLQAHKSCDFGFKKEYHVFDALFVPDRSTRKFLLNSLKRARELIDLKIIEVNDERPELDLKLERTLKLLSFYTETENYARYFDHLYNAKPTQVVGDITPSYSMLGSESFAFIKRMLERYGFAVKVIFIMRDPVERAYSAARMQIRDREAAGRVVKQTAPELLKRKIASPGAIRRGRYDLTIKALEQAFDPGDIQYGFYETLFNDAEVRKICDFLGIEFVPPDFSRRINASPRPTELNRESAMYVRTQFEDVYHFCKEKFGEEFIESIWPTRFPI